MTSARAGVVGFTTEYSQPGLNPFGIWSFRSATLPRSVEEHLSRLDAGAIKVLYSQNKRIGAASLRLLQMHVRQVNLSPCDKSLQRAGAEQIGGWSPVQVPVHEDKVRVITGLQFALGFLRELRVG